MNEKRIQELKNALLELFQAIQSSGEEVTDELESMLVQAMEHVSKRIQELRLQDQEQIELEEAEQEQAEVANEIEPSVQQPSQPTNEPVPPLEQAPHESSHINAFRYDPTSKKLYVKFQDKFPNTNGPVFSYEGIPQNIFDIFKRGAVGPKTSGKNAWHTWKKDTLPSHGAAMYALIKQGGYPYQRIS